MYNVQICQKHRIPVKFINASYWRCNIWNKDRNHLNIGEMFTSYAVNSVMEHEYKRKRLPKKILLIAISEYTLEED